MQSVITGLDNILEAAKSSLVSVVEPMKNFFDIFSNFWLGSILIWIIFAVLLGLCIRFNGKDFIKTISGTRTLSLCAMLIAVGVVLGCYTLTISSFVRIGFGFVTVPVASMLFGPITGCIMGMLQDLIAFLIKPTGGLLINLTLTAGMCGVVYAAFFYRKRITFWRVLCAQLIIIIGINVVLNSIALAPTVASGMIGILPSRLIKNIILLPIQSIIIYVILKTVQTKIN